MKTLIIALGLIFLTSINYCQNNSLKDHSSLKIDCITCHNCEVPTKQDPCLKLCPRDKMIEVNQSPDKGPEVVVLNKLENKYVPVVFSHKLHAQMSTMSGGCKGCHHYNTLGPILPCNNCHEANRKASIDKPDLEAALHRQCMSCHRQWSHSIDCESCHAKKKQEMKVAWQSQVGLLEGKNHPQVETPGKIVFTTNYNKGKLVTFYHNEHINIFKIDCVNCHKNENCIKCHDVQKTSKRQIMALNIPISANNKLDIKHKICISCHQKDDCSKCHSNQPKAPFNHFVTAGWKLNKFHIKLVCTKCHGTSGEFKKLSTGCISCHDDFKPGKFDHKITDVVLDEIHKEASCEDCHIDKNFASAPTCTNCHDDKTFPKNVPGNYLKNNKH